jgi:signal transduction histidine kinase
VIRLVRPADKSAGKDRMSSAVSERETPTAIPPATVAVRAESAAGVIDDAAEPGRLFDKRRLLLLVRTGLTLAIGYLLIFSDKSPSPAPTNIIFVVSYLASNIIIALLPDRILARAGFDIALILADTAAISFALLLIPDADTDVFVFYFTIILLASISDRLLLSLLAPVVTSGAYLAFLLSRHGLSDVLQPAILLRLPFFLLTGTFYAFFVDRVRRGQMAVVAAKQRVEARTELLSMITHDLKQPLWVATQSAALLYDRLRGDTGSTRELAAQVSMSLKRMESLTLNFLDLNRMEMRGLHVTPRRTPLNRIVEDLLDAYRPAFDVHNLRATIELAPGLPPAWIDAMQAERCLSNLLDNAIKYTPAGGTITCRTAGDGQWLTVTIGDSGPGISAERAGTLFARFQDGVNTAGRPSTGLGLHIARALAESLGGDIALDRDQPQGAWFRIRLPAAPEAAAKPALQQCVA